MFGTVIRQARESRRLTQTQLAEISGVAQANISAIEHGNRRPSATTLLQLLTACGFTLEARGSEQTIHVLVNPEDHEGDAPTEHIGARTPQEQNRLLMSALEASEAIVRARRIKQ